MTDAVRVLHVHSGNLYGGVETMLLAIRRPPPRAPRRLPQRVPRLTPTTHTGRRPLATHPWIIAKDREIRDRE
jgi:hypothetical protein